jgi:Tol biopolymer transport system component
MVWFDRAGKPSGSAGEGATLGNPSLARDNRRLLVQQSTGQNIDLWLFDLERNVPTRLTFDPEIDSMPIWSPDGRRMIFNMPRGGGQSLVIRNVDGGAPDEPLLAGNVVAITSDWSPDGQFVLYKQQDSKVGTFDLFAARVQGDRTPIRVAATPYDERDGQFSPDGRSIAFESNESGTPEIYLQPFPGPGQKTRISANGGTQVRWRADGRELFYVASDNTLMSVPMRTGANLSGIGTPVPLFKTRLLPPTTISRQQYVVTSDGQRFLMITTEGGPAPPLTLLSNWRPAAQR